MQEFMMAFQLSKMVIFEVAYYTLGNNKTPHFTTSAEKFVQNKRDFSTCGQAQKHLLPDFPVAMRFFEKWDKYHLMELTHEQYIELCQDLETLTNHYNYLYYGLDESKRPYHPVIAFRDLVEFSKQPVKK